MNFFNVTSNVEYLVLILHSAELFLLNVHLRVFRFRFNEYYSRQSLVTEVTSNCCNMFTYLL